jgi:hypothetical protein
LLIFIHACIFMHVYLCNEAVATVAQDRVEWKSVNAKVTGVFCELRGEKVTKRREARKAKEALQRE